MKRRPSGTRLDKQKKSWRGTWKFTRWLCVYLWRFIVRDGPFCKMDVRLHWRKRHWNCNFGRFTGGRIIKH